VKKESICKGINYWLDEISNIKVYLEDFLTELKELPLHLLPHVSNIYLAINKIIEDLEKIKEAYCQ